MSQEPTIAGMLWGDDAEDAPEVAPELDAAAVIEEHGRKIAKCEEVIGEHSATLEEHNRALAAPKPAAPKRPEIQPDFSSFM